MATILGGLTATLFGLEIGNDIVLLIIGSYLYLYKFNIMHGTYRTCVTNPPGAIYIMNLYIVLHCAGGK